MSRNTFNKLYDGERTEFIHVLTSGKKGRKDKNTVRIKCWAEIKKSKENCENYEQWKRLSEM